jgi:tRNA pseudouridine38-40 synthase
MHNYQILVEYDGTKFVGWQIQKNGLSIQEVLQKAIRKITKNKTIIFGSGRTDAGVHSIGQSAHFKTKHEITNIKDFTKSLNFFISKYNISILKIIKKSKNFHARHSAVKRIYKYYIINRSSPLAIDKNRAWHIKKILDVELMIRGSRLLKGTKDFSTYRSSSCSAKSPIRTIEKIKIRKINQKIEITFISRSFLQQQVRSMVGCLKYLGEKKWNLKHFKKSLFSKKRSMCAPPAPACGLYLYKVKY